MCPITFQYFIFPKKEEKNRNKIRTNAQGQLLNQECPRVNGNGKTGKIFGAVSKLYRQTSTVRNLCLVTL